MTVGKEHIWCNQVASGKFVMVTMPLLLYRHGQQPTSATKLSACAPGAPTCLTGETQSWGTQRNWPESLSPFLTIQFLITKGHQGMLKGILITGNQHQFAVELTRDVHAIPLNTQGTLKAQSVGPPRNMCEIPAFQSTRRPLLQIICELRHEP